VDRSRHQRQTNDHDRRAALRLGARRPRGAGHLDRAWPRIEPVNSRRRRFIGHPTGDEIVLISDEEDPQLRWRFTDIRPNSFRWRGEVSRDGGATWELEEEMHATRRADP
jgi:hypothetical protein